MRACLICRRAVHFGLCAQSFGEHAAVFTVSALRVADDTVALTAQARNAAVWPLAPPATTGAAIAIGTEGRGGGGAELPPTTLIPRTPLAVGRFRSKGVRVGRDRRGGGEGWKSAA